MSQLQRPWWLLVNKSSLLITTIEETYQPGEQTFVIRGEPVIQSLAGLTWGPVGAVLSLVVMTGLAVALEVSERTWAFKLLFIAAFVAVPALAWGLVALFTTRSAQPYLQMVRQTERQSCTIRLNQTEEQLFFQSTTPVAEWQIAYGNIQTAEVTYPIGVREGSRPTLRLDTPRGPLVLLDDKLGNKAQKLDLAEKIRAAVENCKKRA